MVALPEPAVPGIRLFVGAQAGQVQGERNTWTGDAMFTAAHSARKSGLPMAPACALLDSGAFSDRPERRLSAEQALERQLAWEEEASRMWAQPWRASGLVSYDLLIDETWVHGVRHKRRWSGGRAERAVALTVDAARYLAAQRARLAPRTLILSCQGVDPAQYRACVQAVLAVAEPQDWLGLGGWCILGRHTTLLPAFAQTMHEVVPLIAQAGLRHVHVFGVLYRPALGWLLWIADRHGLSVSTDSTAPVLACTWKDWKKAGVRHRHWKTNALWWVEELAGLRHSPYYRPPPRPGLARQLALDWGEEDDCG